MTTTNLTTKNYNLRRKMITALMGIMAEESVSLLEAQLELSGIVGDAVDVIRETFSLECKDLHPYIKGERCVRCGGKV